MRSSRPAADDEGVGAEVNDGWCVLHDSKQPVLNTEPAVLKTEIERRALPCLHTPDQLALRHRDRQP